MLCLSGFELFSRWVSLFNALGLLSENSQPVFPAVALPAFSHSHYILERETGSNLK